MLEPVEVLDSSDSDVNLLLPNSHTRNPLSPTQSCIGPSPSPDTLILNRNCVLSESDGNDNYEVFDASVASRIDEEVTSLGDESSESSAMSVDSATPSSTPVSQSSPSSHAQSAGRVVQVDADLSVVSAYSDRFCTLDSSYEDSQGQAMGASVASSEAVSPPSSQMSQSLPHLRQEQFRLHDSKIESATGTEVFNQSRGRPPRRRHGEARRNQPQQLTLQQQNTYRLQQHLMQQRQLSQPLQQHRELMGNDSSCSRSDSMSSSSSSACESSDGRDTREEEDKKITPSFAGHNSSTLVYEASVTGSTEVVFDDISDWVSRGLTVRGVENDDNARMNKRECGLESLPPIPITPPTPPSHSPSQSEHDSDYPEEDDSPTRVTKIGNVPIAEYEGSPRRYGHKAKPPRPGFPRRVTGQEEVRLANRRTPYQRESQITDSIRERSQFHLQSFNSIPAYSKPLLQEENPLLGIPDITFQPQETDIPKASQIDCDLVNEHDQQNDADGSPHLVISTLTSSYSTLPHLKLEEHPPEFVSSSSTNCDNKYTFEDSETRKVLEEFFLESGKSKGKSREFSDLEYTLKRQHGNSYVGQRLATAECEEDKENNIELCHKNVPLLLRESNSLLEIKKQLESEDFFSVNLQRRQQNFENCSNVQEKYFNSFLDSRLTGLPLSSVQKNGMEKDKKEGIVSANITLSPESTSCDSLDVESEFSGGELEGSLHSAGKVVPTMPVLEDGLSSGEESEIDALSSQYPRHFLIEETQTQVFLDQNFLKLKQQDKDRGRSANEHLCCGEFPPSADLTNGINHLASEGAKTTRQLANGSWNSSSSDIQGNPQATSSPHISASSGTLGLSSPQGVHSPSSSTLNLMKKQITEIEREIAIKNVRRSGVLSDAHPVPLDLHLLDPLSEKLTEPPPPPAPHPHRGGSEGLLDGNSSPPSQSNASNCSEMASPSRVFGQLHSPQFTPVSVSGPQLLSAIGSLTSPVQIAPQMILPSHPDLHPKTGNGVGSSRESVEAAIADIKQAIRRTKNLALKSHPQERSDKVPVWVPRSNRRDQQSSPTGGGAQQQTGGGAQQQTGGGAQQQTQPLQQQLQAGSPSGGSIRSLNDEDDGDTDQETDRLLGQQRSDDTGFLEEKSWRRLTTLPPMPRSLGVEQKEADSEGGGGNSNDSSPSTPNNRGSSNQTSPSSQDIVTSNTIKGKKEKDAAGKKKGRSKEVMVHEPAVLIEGVLFRARYLGSTQLVSEGQPTKTTRMMQAEEAVSRIKGASDEWETSRDQMSTLQSPGCSSPEHQPLLAEESQTVRHPSQPTIIQRDEPALVVASTEPSPTSEVRTDEVIVESVHSALEVLDRRLEEELALFEKEDNLERCNGTTRPADGKSENIYVNFNSFSFMEEKRPSGESLEESLEDPDTTSSSRSLSFRLEEAKDGEREDGSWRSARSHEDGEGTAQGNAAWIVDERGGIGQTGNVFHLHFMGSMEVEEERDAVEGRDKKIKRPRKDMVMEAVARLKAPDGEAQPSTEVDLFISTEKIMVLNTDLKEIMMDHALRTISYIADIGDLVVLMARRRVLPTDEPSGSTGHRIPKMICHVFESEEAQFIAQSIGQAFQVAYLEFLKANGIEDHSFVKEMDYQEVLNSQEIFGDELQMFAKKELQKEVVVPKLKGEILGVVVVESGWGSMVPTVVIANLSPTGAAAKCGQLNIGDQIIAINGISLVGLPLSNCQNYIKNTKYNTAVKLTVVPCPPVVEVKIRRPDTKYQLGFSVQNGVICSLLRGGIAERGGVRVGHRIIDINNQSVVAVPHEKIVNLLATSVGEIRMKTMPTSIFRLLTGQETPQFI